MISFADVVSVAGEDFGLGLGEAEDVEVGAASEEAGGLGFSLRGLAG